ncbi:hypothetical protein PHAVU_011G146700 [Phaseolus vulgaris]|uniref:Uncharacterized protein n=1 Tax=Phaseolus vulgaris TaxID=3885 RepID=V7AJJ7_PHAVU|nr:hypothetical protein PHAVU_011G146700g [Phaseolus vulgaris]ESW05038.1 hypothetical protein PHAVU_011G146700g [Phaseolus vulgaris]
MGGGGAMRTAAKIAGVGVSRSGLRGSTASLPTEQSVRNASRSSVAGVSAQGVKTAEVAPLHAAAPWDDWDFAEDGDLVVPRMVFGSAPTFEEAKEATTELKDAIDQVYLSPDSSKYSSPGDEVSTLSPTLYEPVNRSCVFDTISNPSVPNHAIQAFNLLSTSHEAQAVVASLASDPNVWNAVMENPVVYRFFQSQQTVADFGEVETTEKVEKLSTCASEEIETPDKREATAESDLGSMFSDFIGFLQNLKLTVTELVSSVSDFLQNIFPSPDTQKMAGDAVGNNKANLMGGTFMGLAVLVIMVIVTKRA